MCVCVHICAFVCVCVYVCMCVCVYVMCVYMSGVCMYVCMDVFGVYIVGCLCSGGVGGTCAHTHQYTPSLEL